MLRFRILWLILLCVALGARADETHLVISTNNTPLDRKALERLSQAAAQRIGVNIQLVSNPSERSLFMANQGEVDGEGLRIAGLNQHYPNLVQVQERFIGISFVAFSKDASINLDQSWNSLKPYRVAFINGWKMFEANTAEVRSVTKVDKPEQLFRMLDGGRVDLALYTRADGVALLKTLGLRSIAPISPSLKEVDMYLYLHKKHQALAPRIAQALREMKADGTYNKIMFDVLTD
ncbi:MAG: transporter substrate-binding domain-containing protein [Dechloromonas sp.]|nr:transporter substrate-binding domain-containing protein [Dechloromonas sp.]